MSNNEVVFEINDNCEVYVANKDYNFGNNIIINETYNNTFGVYKVRENALVPKYETEGSGCFDLAACFDENSVFKSYNSANREVKLNARRDSDGDVSLMIPVGNRVLIPTGLIFDIPRNYQLRIVPRSSTGLKLGLIQPNSVGEIDSDYINETFLMFLNISEKSVFVKSGTRLAQGYFAPVCRVDLIEVFEAPEQKTSRTGGFGSTG